MRKNCDAFPGLQPVTHLQKALLWAAAVIWLALAIAPSNRGAWLLENVLLFVGVAWVIGTYRYWRLSETSYCLIFAFVVLHTIGAHFTYSKVPFGEWLRTGLSLHRNYYDRLVHLSFGLLLAYPFRDQVIRASRSGPVWGSVIALMIITSLSTGYELMEWAVAEIAKPEDAAAFLGMQGDLFDAQKDCALAVLGAALSLIITGIIQWCARATGARFQTHLPAARMTPLRNHHS